MINANFGQSILTSPHSLLALYLMSSHIQAGKLALGAFTVMDREGRKCKERKSIKKGKRVRNVWSWKPKEKSFKG